MNKPPSMLDQYQAIKEKHKKHLLLFRLGDFYELFFEDAKVASKELELTLTKREFSKGNSTPMCGVPYHSVDVYIKRLVEKGYKVAICEQLEEAKPGKGLVSREVVRVITPGTVTDSSTLDAAKNNYICSLYVKDEVFGIAFADISTGNVYVTQKETKDISAGIVNELDRFMPVEILFNESFVDLLTVAKYLKNNLKCTAELFENNFYDANQADAMVKAQFGDKVKECGIDKMPVAVLAMYALLTYLKDTQKQGVNRLVDLATYQENQFMGLDVAARRNLELTQTMRTEEKRGSLLGVLDRTKTAMGKRLMRQTIEQPLVNPAKIIRRQDAVEKFLQNSVICDELITQLDGVYDLERLMTRVMYGSVTPRELKALSYTAAHLPMIKQELSKLDTPLLKELNLKIGDMKDVHQLIEDALVDEPPLTMKDGGIIKCGFNEELDELRDIRDNGKGFILKLEEQEKQNTGIKKLKIGYNRVFGYYIEVSNQYLDMIPNHYVRKQTLSNCERYITNELKEYEHKVLASNERAISIEVGIFEDLRRYVADRLVAIQSTAGAVALVDVLCSFAKVSRDYQYSRPEILSSGEIMIKEGRHPVVETMLEMPFVPNDTRLDNKKNLLAMITGPNMAGKSTYMRQVALIVLMTQIGCFVPAMEAKISLVDHIFTRVGASDDLSAGQSTFMVEMSEVADILHHASPSSLIILDEIGRGTSTFDGMSIAQAVIEYIIESKRSRAKTLFATHYHELTSMRDAYPCVQNYSIAVKKRGDDIVFLRKIVRGAADDSYGIAVAKLAGIPNSVIARANEILEQLESQKGMAQENHVAKEVDDSPIQIRFEDTREKEILRKIEDVSIDALTPIEALNTLFELKKMVG